MHFESCADSFISFFLPVIMQLLRDNLTLWTSDMQDSESKPTDAPAAEAPAAEAKGEEAA
jgi:14-3-3 protein epsilon